MRRFLFLISIVGFLAFPSHSFAAAYGDDLAKCLVEASTKKDKEELARWIFSAISAHPSVKPLSSVTPDQRQLANKSFADILMRLLTVSCREKAEKAIRYEGTASLQQGFSLLGQVAMQHIFADPSVLENVNGIDKYLDIEKLGQLQPLAPKEKK
jgi:hypothetical protein